MVTKMSIDKLTSNQVLDLIDGFIPITELPGGRGGSKKDDKYDKKDKMSELDLYSEMLGQVEDVYSNNPLFDE